MRKSSLALAFITGLALVACKTNPSEFEGFTKAENGLYYKFGGTHDEKGTKPQIGDMLKLYYRFALTKNDSVILDSKKDSREGNGIVAIPMFKSSFKGSIEDGISMMCKGDSATFIVAADSFFLKTMMAKELPKNVKPGDKVTACIKLHDIKPKQQVQQEQQAQIQQMAEQEKAKIATYLAQNNISSAPTASGLFIVEKVKGKGKQVKQGDIVQAYYTGMFTDGNVFDSNKDRHEPLEFPAGGGQVIPGWDEAVLSMTVGTKATLVIPSAIGYGPQGDGRIIPPYCPLVFEIEVVGIKSAK